MNVYKEFSFLKEHPYFVKTDEYSQIVSFYFRSIDEETGEEFPSLLFIDISKTFKIEGVSTDEGFTLNRFPWFDELYKKTKEYYKEKNRLRFIVSGEMKD